MTVAKRLALGFGATVALGVGIVVYAATTFGTMSTDIDLLANNRMLKVTQFSTIKDNLQSIGRYARNTLIKPDPAFVAGEKAKIAELRAANTELIAKLEKTVVLPAGLEFLKTLQDNRGPYNAAIDKAMDLAARGEKEAAAELLIGEVRERQAVVFKAVDDSVALQRTLAVELAEKGRATASTSAWTVSILAAVMALIGVLVGWSMNRYLRRALGAEPAVLSAEVAQVAAGDLSRKLTVANGDSGSVMANVAQMQSRLLAVVTTVRANSESVATASAQIAQGNQDLSQRTEEQASALQQTAATMDQLGTTVRHNADSAQQANQLALGASEVAARGGAVVGEVVETMKGINQSSQKIADIIGTIDGIAFQTNILALNAAVEAARAGDQGRGFAVVAGEVRTLAQRSAQAAKEIKSLIGHSVEQVERGTALVDRAGNTMNEIVTAIGRVSDIVGEISSSSVEQSGGVTQVAHAVNQMDQVTQQNAALVEESAAAAESLRVQAQQMVQTVAVFKLDGVTSTPRAAAASLAAVGSSLSASRTAMTPPSAAKSSTAGRQSARVEEAPQPDWAHF
ncbi:methyl-accepting chemotaxis protein [Aquincola tertiaricarbonis]|uniref:methyl-accepting chemotaxis protein n=1 Tax=Aquincola tertiaricarbonis TaxID=391953 RepID=UPI002873B7C1|nr:methyl-accepting chemotaxis protein [Aquincola tertiaricarbonis]